MVAKDPKNRLTASEVLRHPWFTMKHTKLVILTNAQENIKKYQNTNRFNLSKIKPEFSMVTCTPLLNSRFSGKDSPLIVPKMVHKKAAGSKAPDLLQRRNKPEEKKQKLGGIVIRDIYDKFQNDKPAAKENTQNDSEDSGDFNAMDMDENTEEMKLKIPGEYKSFVPRNIKERKLPTTPGFAKREVMSNLKHLCTPSQNHASKKHYKNCLLRPSQYIVTCYLSVFFPRAS